MVTQHELNTIEQLKAQLHEAIAQAIHDIQSPLMCLLTLCANQTNSKFDIKPNDLRIRILGILKSIQQSVNEPENNIISSEIIIVPQVIKNILAEKSCEYANLPITFQSNIYSCKEDTTIVGNMDSFSRVLSNLINNAVEAFANKSGVITINCDCDDDKIVRVIIEDDGQGMSEEIKTRILNNEIATDKPNGKGLGLAHTRETLGKCGGTLNIESRLGSGTKVILALPYANKVPFYNSSIHVVGSSKIISTISSALKKVDIVIVEDDRNNADTLVTFIFKDKKADVFNSAHEFLANFHKYPLDTVILIDYQFSDESINGIDVCKALYDKGFTNYYLYSGMEFKVGELPNYIKLISKTDTDKIGNLIS